MIGLGGLVGGSKDVRLARVELPLDAANNPVAGTSSMRAFQGLNQQVVTIAACVATLLENPVGDLHCINSGAAVLASFDLNRFFGKLS